MMATPAPIGAQPLAGEAFQPFVWCSAENGDQAQFQILGSDAQLLQVFLPPDASVRAEPGALCFMSDLIEIDTRMEGGLGGLLGRAFAGESFFTNTLTNKGTTAGYVAFHPPSHAKVVPLDLLALGGSMLCQQDSYMVSIGDVSVSAAMAKRVSAGILGGEGLWLQRLSGRGLAFISAQGTLVQKALRPGESVVVDAGCLVAFSESIDFRVKWVGSVRRAIFGGEGLFFATLTGPGVVILQSVRERGGGGGAGGRGGGDAAAANRRSGAATWRLLIAMLFVLVPLMLAAGVAVLELLDEATRGEL